MYFTGSLVGVQPTSSRPVWSYSGGKSQIAPQLVSLLRHHFPTERHLLSPFLGGGAVELRFMHACRGSCHAADAEQPLVNLWRHITDSASFVAGLAQNLLPIDAATWEDWYADMERNVWDTADDAARYFILRNTKVVHAWSLWEGQMEAFNKPKKHKPALSRLARFKAPRLTVEHADFRDFLSSHDGPAYCDPPYHSERGEKERVYANRKETNVFSQADHEALADLLCQRTGWVLSNANTEWVRTRYADYPQIPVRVRYSSRQMHESMETVDEELIIISR